MKKPKKGGLVALVCGLLVLALAGFAAFRWEAVYFWWHGYRIAWLPPEVSGVGSYGQMNSAGQIAVTVGRADGEERAARWSLSTRETQFLGELPGAGPRSLAMKVNRKGDVIGTTYEGNNHLARAFLWTEGGGMTDIGSLGGSQAIR